jgi:polysaccharide biosynthesis protein PslH
VSERPGSPGRRPRVLVVTKLLPLPADGGGKQRSAALLKRLAKVADVTIGAFDDGTADHDALAALGVRVVTRPWRPDLAGVLTGLFRTRGLTSSRFWDPQLAKAISAEASTRPPDVLVLEYVQLEALVRGVRAQHRILATHNVESTLIRTLATVTRGPKRLAVLLDAAALRRMERRLIPRYDTTVVVSRADLNGLPARPRATLICPNGQEPAETSPRTSAPNAVFVAQLGWAPNVDAALWLCREIWPEVRRQRSDASVTLVGRNPTDDVLAFDGTAGITVVGTVPSVRPYVEEALIALAPLRAGSGTRLKILEALAHGRPVVATELGAEGLEDLVGSGVVLANDPRKFATEVVSLLDDPARAQELGEAGRLAVIDRYSWDSSFAPLVDAVLKRDGSGL